MILSLSRKLSIVRYSSFRPRRRRIGIFTDNCPLVATGEVLYHRSGTAAQTTVPAIVYIPGGNYLINSSLQLPVQTMLSMLCL